MNLQRTDKSEHVNVLSKCLEIADNDFKKLKVLIALIPARFDQTLSSTAYMPIENWKWWVFFG